MGKFYSLQVAYGIYFLNMVEAFHFLAVTSVIILKKVK